MLSLLFVLFLFFRAFIAWEENLPVDPDKEHAQRLILAEYKKKLILDWYGF